MRSHGVSNFPDPTAAVPGQGGGGFAILKVAGSATVTVSGVPLSGPAFTTAAKTCGLSAATKRTPITEAQKEAFIAKARCIRTHGVPNFPTPFIAPNGDGVGINLPAGFNSEAPAYIHAEKACVTIGANIPGVGAG
jgi:hypothetical protein